MQSMKEFTLWFLSELPDFLMSEPVCYLVGFFFLGVAVMMFKKLIR